MSVSTVSLWCARSAGARLDRFDFEGKRPGRASNRTAAAMERRVVRLRRRLREHSVLGEYGGQAIGRALRAALNSARPSQRAPDGLPARATIYRILHRHGALDGVARTRRPAPPKGWYLPDVGNR